jgi:hypothetical protein
MTIYRHVVALLLVLSWGSSFGQGSIVPCLGADATRWHNCQGAVNFANGDRYEGEFQNGKFHGWATYYHLADNPFLGDRYVGEFRNGQRHGQGRYTFSNGKPTQEGVWADSQFVRADKVTIPLAAQSNFAMLAERKKLEDDRLRLAQERRQLEEDRAKREQAKANSRLELRVTASTPDPSGLVVITVQTGGDTSSLKIDGDEQGANEQGNYQIKRLPRVGRDTTYTITAVDTYGNTSSKAISLRGQAMLAAGLAPTLKPETLKLSPARDAVAIIIGIQDYKSLPKADFANEDARAFYDYAVRALGIKRENIKMLIDSEAEQVGILSAFRNWLPSYVKKDQTDVYVFYSGHGLPSTDGKSLFFLPQGSDKDFLTETGISQTQIVAALNASKPRSVTMFIDSCYSGSTRSGETLLASARPVALKASENPYPANFTVVSASSLDQISSSSPELKHGIFSFYLMKGLEGEADENKDGKITVAELQSYIADMVPRQALKMNRRQQPQLVGDTARVLVSR